MEPETGTLIVRQTFLDRSTEKIAELKIERTGVENRPSPVTAESIDKGLITAGNLVAGASLMFSKWAKNFRKHTNKLPMMDPGISNAAGGDPKIVYFHSYWVLEPDEALVIEVKPPECENWNFQLNNHWMESLDYRYYTIHVNKHTAEYRKDGCVIIVVAHEDPGHPNWIFTAGHRCGTMCLRWIKASSYPVPETRVIKLPELDKIYGV
jgi:hypothetical protein